MEFTFAIDHQTMFCGFYFLLRFRDKSAKINEASINFEKNNSIKVIFKANCGNVAKSQNQTISSKFLHRL